MHINLENKYQITAFPLLGSRGAFPRQGGPGAFTLVELIVVVTILALLSTIGFVSYSSYLSGVRDTNRLSQLVAISDGLELYRTKKTLPIPDDNIEIRANGTVIGYQGYAGINVLETIDYSKTGKDPKDKTYFSYYLTQDKKHYQLLTYLEEEENLETNNNLFQKVHADIDYTNRYPKVSGKRLGILTQSGTNIPVQEVTTIVSSGYLDLDTNTEDYIANLDDANTISGTGKLLVAGATRSIAGTNKKSCKDILEKHPETLGVDGTYEISPTSTETIKVYCDMTTDGGGWILVVYNKSDSSSVFDKDFMIKEVNSSKILLKDLENYLSSINPEKISKLLNTNDAMLKSTSYSSTPIIDNGTGLWSYDSIDCSGNLGHTARTVGCSNHSGNDNYNSNDRFNIAIYLGNTSIVPYHSELCWSGKGRCDFEFYLR